MNAEKIEIKIIKAADRAAIKKLYQDAGWWETSDEKVEGDSWIDALVKQSFCFAGAYCKGELIGMGRAVSDGVSDAYIQDVVISSEFRRSGVGKAIMEKILDFLRKRKIGWIGLIAAPGTQQFYRQLGFEPMAGYVPMRWKGRAW